MQAVPNILSISRLIIAPLFFVMLISESVIFQKLAILLFFLGALSDYFDGWIARKYNVESKIGKFIDPLADKFLTGFAFLSLSLLGVLPLYLVVLLIVFDIGTTLLRVLPTKKRLETSKIAKLKTMSQMLFVSYLLTLFFGNLVFGENLENFFLFENLIFNKANIFVLIALILISAVSFLSYLKQIFEIK